MPKEQLSHTFWTCISPQVGVVHILCHTGVAIITTVLGEKAATAESIFSKMDEILQDNGSLH